MLPVIKRPADCTDEEIRAFAQMVIEGGQVSPAGFERNVRRAKLLGFAYEDGELAGVVGIKSSPWLYVREVFLKANKLDEAVDFRYEIGWGYTKPEFRKLHINRRLVELQLATIPESNVFAMTGVGNEAVISNLIKLGFEKCGDPYPNSTGSWLYQLWVKKGSAARNSGKWFLKSIDLVLRGVERSDRCKSLLRSFHKKVKTRRAGAH
jgi:ribosomal protein S18 acetylase RimI-like enzyme